MSSKTSDCACFTGKGTSARSLHMVWESGPDTCDVAKRRAMHSIYPCSTCNGDHTGVWSAVCHP